MTAQRDGQTSAPSPHKRKERDDQIAAEDSEDEKPNKKPKGDPKGGKERRDRSKGKAHRAEAAVASTSEPKAEKPEKRGIEKDGQNIGSLIGRKRRQKAGK
jgi:nucleolar protein 4